MLAARVAFFREHVHDAAGIEGLACLGYDRDGLEDVTADAGGECFRRQPPGDFAGFGWVGEQAGEDGDFVLCLIRRLLCWQLPGGFCDGAGRCGRLPAMSARRASWSRSTAASWTAAATYSIKSGRPSRAWGSA